MHHTYVISDMTRRLTITEKCKILDKLSEPSVSQREVAVRFGVSRKTVQNVIKNKECIRRLSQCCKKSHRCHAIIDERFAHINVATFRWFEKMRENHCIIPLTESVICKKALQFARKFEATDFKASSGWYRSWKRKYQLNLYKVMRNMALLYFRFVGN